MTAATPAAAAHWKRIGSSAAGRPIELIRRSWAANAASTSGMATVTTSWRAAMPEVAEVGVEVGLDRAAECGDGHRHPTPRARP